MHASAVPLRHFATHGPCDPTVHHHLDPLARLPHAQRLLTDGSALALRAPPGGGRSTTAAALVTALTDAGHPVVTFAGSTLDLDPNHLDDAEATLLAVVERAAAALPPAQRPPPWRLGGPWQCLAVALADWRRAAARPPVVIIDDLDRLPPAVAGLLRAQIAASGVGALITGGHEPRGADPYRLGRGAPAVWVPPFDLDEIIALYARHADATGQGFTPAACARALDHSGGQPWLVAALGREVAEGLAVRGDVEPHHVDLAAGRLYTAWPAGFERLATLIDDRAVWRVALPLMLGGAPTGPTVASDLDRARAAGLVHADGRAAGAIPLGVMLKTATHGLDRALPPPPDCARPDGGFDLPRAMSSFSSAWKARGARIITEHATPGIAPVLAAVSHLDRVVPAGTGRWQAALGAGHLALHAELPLTGRRRQRAVVLVKLRGPHDAQPLDDGLAALDTVLGDETGDAALILFDGRDPYTSLGGAARLAWEHSPRGREVLVIRG